MSSDDKMKSIFSDLGRPTRRGVRRCPKCGMLNGSRGLICKYCNCSFKEKRTFNTETCKLKTGNATQIFSIKVHDKGPDYRGFVQFPRVPSQAPEPFIPETAVCFVDCCQRLFDTSILKCHETDPCAPSPLCPHIEAALKCAHDAAALPAKARVLAALNVCDEYKQELYQLMAQSPAPLVQRVARNVMVVKCQVSPKHPLGYLHFALFQTKVKDRTESRYHCSCADFKGQSKNGALGQYKYYPPMNHKKCVHFYACICAFASDAKLAEEFASYINAEDTFQNLNDEMAMSENENSLASVLHNDLIDARDFCNIEVEVLNDRILLDVPNISLSECMDSNVQVQNLEINANGEVTIVNGLADDNALEFSDLSENLRCLSEPLDIINPSLAVVPTPTKRTKLDPSWKSPKHGKARQSAVTVEPVAKHKKLPAQKQDTTTAEEKQTQVAFVQWLASVTERINQAMHYQFSGKPDALIFHAPQVFFDCLRERMSLGGTKKRLPNYTSAFIRKEAVPIGTFTKYTWHITNILHLKQIFETPLVSLEITRSFVQNRDGTYDVYVPKGDENDGVKSDGLVPIKPLELKTYLKVGNTAFNQVEPTPFIIEWIPDILPITKIGELRIRFEYGHQKETNCSKSIRTSKKESL